MHLEWTQGSRNTEMLACCYSLYAGENGNYFVSNLALY